MFRIPPAMGPENYKSYQIRRPWATHWVPATCEAAGCLNHLQGWQTVVPADSPQADYIRHDRSRRHAETQEAGLSTFTFEAGQTCFTQHKVPADRQEIFVVKDGDWRGNPRGTAPRIHQNADDWVEDFALHQDRIKTQLERG